MNPDKMHYFLEIYGRLFRAGPGSDELTRRALKAIPDLPETPRILDVGCGPGAQTVELLRSSAGTVVAVDILPEMIERVEERARGAGVSARLTTVQCDMGRMEFQEASFDLVWSEGAIYNLGFETGLREIRRFLKPGGSAAVSEAVWLRPDPPAGAREFWREYPEIDAVEAKLDIIQRAGYELITHFVFPPAAWMDQYYDPMEIRVAEMEPAWKGIPEAEEVLKEAAIEIDSFRKFSDWFSYAFFVMRLNEEQSI